MRLRPLPLAALMLAACSQQAPSPAPTDREAVPSPTAVVNADRGPTPITEVGDLLGEYRVAGIDGQPLEAPIGIAVSIDGPMLSFEPTCAGFVWSLRFENGALVTTRLSEVRVAPGDPPPPVCAVALLPEQRLLAQAFDAADKVTRTPANGILFEGGGRSALLFSQ